MKINIQLFAVPRPPETVSFYNYFYLDGELANTVYSGAFDMDEDIYPAHLYIVYHNSNIYGMIGSGDAPEYTIIINSGDLILENINPEYTGSFFVNPSNWDPNTEEGYLVEDEVVDAGYFADFTTYHTTKSSITYNITTTLTNLTASGDSTIDSDGTATVTLSANSGYTLPSSITVTNAQYTYDRSTGVISLSNATADVTISASGVKITISSFNELEIIDHTEYITLRVQDTTINVAKQTTPAEWDGTDLTGTSWVINSTTCTAGYGQFDVIHYVNDVYEDYSICIGYQFGGRPASLISSANMVTSMQSITYWNIGDVISISGGTDATNQDLIDWLQANATLISW